MTPRDRFILALEPKPLLGRVPHFELVFFLTMEAFGKVHPLQWDEKQRLYFFNQKLHLYRHGTGAIRNHSRCLAQRRKLFIQQIRMQF